MFSSDKWFGAEASFYNGVATQSLRLDGGSGLTRTPSSSGNQKTWTWSSWVKRANLGNSQLLFGNRTSGSDVAWIYFNASNQFYFQNYEGSTQLELKTNALFRDVTSWYHVMVVLDTTQSTSSNRAKLYVNGEQITSLATSTYPSQNADLKINTGSESHSIGFDGSSSFLDGYFSEVNFVDGLALDPTYFGETKNGVWIAKKYTGAYGTNGFRLEFKQTGVGSGSSSTIGADTSGNGNHYTSSGIVASDCNMPDSPENNFCTLNGVAKSAGLTLSNGNLQTNNANDFALGTIGVSSGKWYYENYINSTNGGFAGVYESDSGVYSSTIDDGGNNPDGYGYYNNGNKLRDNSYQSYGSSFQSAGDIIGVALDMDNGAIYFSKNGTWQGGATTSEIASGTTTNAAFTGLSGTMVARVGHYNNNNPTIVNFGQDASFAGAITAGTEIPDEGVGVFKYPPPSGFLALCSANLPEPTIGPNSATQADDNFNTVLYSGTGSAQSITGVGFQPDWVWVKKRNTPNRNHAQTDSSRGATKALFSSLNDAETTNAQGLTSFDSDGFSLGTYDTFNESSGTYVSWNWKANGGTTSSNSDGTITSTVQANTTAGFSIITYTGNATAGATIGHGLGKAPKWVTTKARSGAYSWLVGHDGIASDAWTDALLLDTSGAASDSNLFWNDTVPSSTVVTLGGAYNPVNGNGITYVMYAFAEIEGYSKFGSVIGNGSTDGTFVYTGFRPAWIMVKCTTTTNDWFIYDIVRDTFNVVENILAPNLSNAESGVNTPVRNLDILSNGFKARGSDGFNLSGQTHIYMAFAEQPFKFANAR